MAASIPKADAPAYTDLAGLSKLKRAAGANDPKAIRTVAEQFESMFTRMMLKSMRDAIGPDPMFGSDQEQMYQGMADDQLSVQLSKGKGLGLADMLVRQLQKMGVKGAADATASGAGPGAKAAAAYSNTQKASAPPTTATTPDVTKSNFIQDLWPQAQDAGQLLGVDHATSSPRPPSRPTGARTCRRIRPAAPATTCSESRRRPTGVAPW